MILSFFYITKILPWLERDLWVRVIPRRREIRPSTTKAIQLSPSSSLTHFLSPHHLHSSFEFVQTCLTLTSYTFLTSPPFCFQDFRISNPKARFESFCTRILYVFRADEIVCVLPHIYAEVYRSIDDDGYEYEIDR